jgi:hypothetical protein
MALVLRADPFWFVPKISGRIHGVGFGWINIGGERYDQDRILYPEGVSPPWFRARRHLFQKEDLEEIVERYQPEIFILGTGWTGMMRVDGRAKRKARSLPLEWISAKTPQAVEIYNQIRRFQKEKRVVVALHLTC